MIEANELLGSFDSRLREYAARRLTREGVQLVKGVVKEVRQKEVELQARRAPAGACHSQGYASQLRCSGLPSHARKLCCQGLACAASKPALLYLSAAQLR